MRMNNTEQPRTKEIERQEPNNPRFDFVWIVPADQEIERTTRDLLLKGVHFLREFYGKDFEFSPDYEVRMTSSQKHGAAGAEISVSVPVVQEYRKQKDPYLRAQHESGFVHELVHNIFPDEAMPMLAELAYMLERGYAKRLSDLAVLLRDGRLDQPYLDGLKGVADELGVSVEILLNPEVRHDLEQIRNVFRRAVEQEMHALREERAGSS